MTPITFWFDVVSPYAWLAFDRLPQALEGSSYVVEYRPLLFAGLLKSWGQKGPAEVAPKRAWTYRQIAWLAHAQGTPLELPRPHPFNPLALQRLALAASADGRPNRRTVELLFRHAWCAGGADPNDPVALAALTAAVAPQRDPASDEVKNALRAATDEAVARGIFGVPTLEAEGRQFWGQDALPMLRAALQRDPWFDGPAWDEAGQQPLGVQRAR
ncbi:DsbA family protein [Aquincola sp. S2]|uniref:2-hydroxychromene-2-carboxylate isomerase n=1 Tax=Pseudaquabacterium terrae TaxID=2732868 RepID=A0ABX2EDB1_9BURK|nr:DsbA family protein [Aquabacterium terrae]NRF66010.1 DsbA family protein [Aquabacterium terrae]